MVSTVLERTGTRLVHNRAGANMVGGVASALAAAARRGGRRVDGDLGLFEVDEFWLAPVVERARARARSCSPTCSATSSTATASWRRSPTAGRSWSPAAPAARSWCSTPTTRWSPTSAASAGTPLYFGVDDDVAGAARSSSTRRLQALPPLRARRTSTTAIYLGHLGHYHCPNCGQTRPEPAVVRRATSSCTASAAPRSRCARRAASAASSCRCPGSTTSTTRSAPRRCAWRSAPADDVVGRLGGRRARVRARRDDRPRRAPDLDPAGQEPRRAPTRSCARSRSRARELDLLRRPQRPHRRRPRRLVGVGRRLGGAGAARAADDLLGHARRRAGAADEVRGRGPGAPARRRGPRGGPRRARWPTARARCTSCPPTPRCWSCASCSPAAARPGSTGDERLRHGRLARRGVRRATPPTCALWRELAAREGGPVLDVGAGTGRVALASPPPGTRSSRWTATPSCWRSCASARGRRRHGVETVRRRRRGLRARRRRFALDRSCRCRRSSCCPTEPRRVPARARGARCARRPLAIAIADALEAFDEHGAAPGARRRRASTACATSPSRSPCASAGGAVRIERVRAIARPGRPPHQRGRRDRAARAWTPASSRPRPPPTACGQAPARDRRRPTTTSAPRW